MSTLSFARSLRMIWIDAALAEDGELNRSDLESAFMVSMYQASADIRAFNRIYPGLMAYDASAKMYRKVEGMPSIYSASAHRAAFDAVGSFRWSATLANLSM